MTTYTFTTAQLKLRALGFTRQWLAKCKKNMLASLNDTDLVASYSEQERELAAKVIKQTLGALEAQLKIDTAAAQEELRNETQT